MALARRSLLARQRRAAGIPRYSADFRLIRGACAKPRCGSRLGVVRMSIDYTSRKDREVMATIECAKCGRTWRRIKPPKLGEYQSVRLTLLLPGDQRRWFARGRYHVTGTDHVEITEGTWPDLLEAEAQWRKRNDAYTSSVAKAKATKEAKAAAERLETAAWLARMGEKRAERDREEAEAAAREKENER